MERKESFVYKRPFSVSAKTERMEFLAVGAVLFILGVITPLLLTLNTSAWVAAKNQFLIGPLVNCALVIAGVNFRGFKRIWTIIFLPSIFTLLTGIVFSLGSIYVLYMVPAIWLGNASMVLMFKYLHVHKKVNYTLTAALAVTLKVTLIFTGFLIMKSFADMPLAMEMALTAAMSVNQIINASIGCVMAFGILKLTKKFK